MMREILERGLARLHLSLSDSAIEQLLSYVQLLLEWNHTHNLTAVRDPKEMVIRHILDSLTLVPYIRGSHILDVGTGAGLPGIPLAIAMPDREFVLVDSNTKKISFLTYVVARLKLKNVKIEKNRVEHFRSTRGFDTITTRAVAAVSEVLKMTSHLYHSGGCLLVMKGKLPTEELKQLRQQVVVYKVETPFLQEERHIICVERAGE